MKFKNIEAFLAVAENLSFSKAAAQLGCSQATVTVQIKELENELGALLFDRMNKSVKLTSAGASFCPTRRRLSSTPTQCSASSGRRRPWRGTCGLRSGRR